jgi:NTE family protein
MNEGIERALVLGGGGPVGRAWLAGLITGLRAEGVDLGRAELLVGTSAGAVAGAQLLLGIDLVDVVNDEIRAPGPAIYTPAALARLGEAFAEITAANASPDPEQARAALGAKALAADTVTEDVFLTRHMYAVLAGKAWPTQLRATSVSATTGKLAVWSADSGVELHKAVASSTALPGVSPAVTLNGDRYLDGGVRSMLNADLAVGARSVVVVSCFALADRNAAAAELDAITSAGSALTVVEPSQELIDLTDGGLRMLDLTLQPAALQVGRNQASTEAARLAAWN